MKTIEEINKSFEEYQEELELRELHLKLLPSFNKEPIDDLFSLLNEINGKYISLD